MKINQNSNFIFFSLLFFSIYLKGQEVPIKITNASQIEILKEHNKYRWALGLIDLVYSPALQHEAEVWVRNLAIKDKMYHDSKNKNHGENLAWANYTMSIKEAIGIWGSERINYNHFTHRSASVTGHYTQIVWKSTTKVGCASSVSDSGKYYWVCRYDPSGNFVEQKPFNAISFIKYLQRKKEL